MNWSQNIVRLHGSTTRVAIRSNFLNHLKQSRGHHLPCQLLAWHAGFCDWFQNLHRLFWALRYFSGGMWWNIHRVLTDMFHCCSTEMFVFRKCDIGWHTCSTSYFTQVSFFRDDDVCIDWYFFPEILQRCVLGWSDWSIPYYIPILCLQKTEKYPIVYRSWRKVRQVDRNAYSHAFRLLENFTTLSKSFTLLPDFCKSRNIQFSFCLRLNAKCRSEYSRRTGTLRWHYGWKAFA